MDERRRPRRWPAGLLILAAAVIGGSAMAVARALTGQDRAAALAERLGLGNGIVLGALLGVLTGAWLALGGRRRVAGFAGLMLGLAAGWLLVRMGTGHLWVIDVVLTGAFGPPAREYTPLAALLLLYLVVRGVWGTAAAQLLALLRGPDRAPAGPPGAEGAGV